MVQVNDDSSETVVVTPECVPCPSNTYQYVQGQLQCISCPEYHITTGNSTRLPEDCVLTCTPGEYSVDGLAPCNKCPIGQYQNSSGQLECVMCPENYSTRNNGNQGLEDCLQLCSPGEYSVDGFIPCNKCPIGQYQNSSGQLECVMCPENHNTHSNGSREVEDCARLCSSGEYSADGLAPCSKCPIGQYQNLHHQLECAVCPTGQSTRNTGSQQIEDCVQICSPGEYSVDGFKPCDKCSCGSYSNEYGAEKCYNCSIDGAPQDQCMGKHAYTIYVQV